jgi:ElaB/YqjD/DUF883 family membrane-anchored ribosome-binding protein
MNDIATENAAENAGAATNEIRAEADACIRRNPGSALLVAISAGVVIGLLVRSLRPAPTPRDRITDLLEDLNSRVRDLASPVWRKAASLASDGLQNAQSGEARAERFLGDSMRRLRNLFS